MNYFASLARSSQAKDLPGLKLIAAILEKYKINKTVEAAKFNTLAKRQSSISIFGLFRQLD